MKKADIAAFRRVMSHYGRLAAGVPKTMSSAALAQRRAAGKASAIARGLARSDKRKTLRKKITKFYKGVPPYSKKGLARSKKKFSTPVTVFNSGTDAEATPRRRK